MQCDSIGANDEGTKENLCLESFLVPISHRDNNFRRRALLFEAKCGQFYKLFLLFILFTNAVICSESRRRPLPESCSKSREILSADWGLISDGPPLLNYTENTHCEWLIKPNLPNKFISLQFTSMATECSYDYIFV